MNQQFQYKIKVGVSGSFFTLENEPNGWDKLDEELRRSKETDGIFRFISTSLTFTFINGGATELQEEWNANGYDSSAEIEIYENNYRTNQYELSYYGKLDFTTYSKDVDGVTLKYIDSSETEKYDKRKDVEISLGAAEDLDGNTYIPAESLQNINIKPIEIILNGTGTLTHYSTNVIGFGLSFPVSIIKTVPGIPITTVTGTIDTNTIGSDFTMEEVPDGIIYTNSSIYTQEVYIELNGKFQYSGAGTTPPDKLVTVRARLIATNKNEISIGTLIDSGNVVYDPDFLTPLDIPYSGSNTYTIAPNEEIKIRAYFEASSTATYECQTVLAESNITDFKVTSIPIPETTSKAWSIYDACNKSLKLITGKGLKADGILVADAINNMLMSGRMIRNFPDSNMNIKWKELFHGIKSIKGVGLWFDKINDYWEIQELDYFYQNLEIVNVTDEVKNLKIKPYKESAFDIISSGYKEKGDYEQIQGAFEFNIKSSHYINILNEKKLDNQSKLNADAIGIELARREQYPTTGSTDTKQDEKNYILDCQDNAGTIESIRADEIATSISGFEGVEQYHNLRFTPRFCLLNNSGKFNSYLNKTSSKTVQFTSNVKETDITYTIGGVTNSETEAIQVSEMNNPLYNINIYEFEAYLTTEQWNAIKANPHGYITFIDLGIEYKGYILKAKREMYKKTCKFTLIEKYTA